MKDYVDSAKLQEYTTKFLTKLKTIFPGTPTAVLTAAEMTDHGKVYVYAGTEVGYTAGDWYYWDGSAWASGGVYNAEAIVTDTTLSVPGMAADAEATGDAVGEVEADVADLRSTISNDTPIIPSEEQTQTGYFKVNSANVVSVQSVASGATDRAYTIDLSSYIGNAVSVLIANPGSVSVRQTGTMSSSNKTNKHYQEKEAGAVPWVFDITAEYPILFCSVANPATSPVTITVLIPGTVIGPIKTAVEAISGQIGDTPMGTEATTLTGAIAEVNAKIDTKESYISIQPTKFPQLPYPIYKDSFGAYSIGADILADKDISNYNHYYVDSVNGSDSNAGTTELTALQSLYKALYKARNQNAVITIAEGSILWDDGLYGEYLVNGNLVIEGNGCTLIWGVEDPDWTETETTGVYVSKDLSEEICGACVDMSSDNIDMYGLYKGMKPAASIAALGENQYFYDTTRNLMYACPRAGGSIDNIHPLRTSYGLWWKNLTATVSSFIFLKDIKYIGNYYMAVRSANYPQSSYTFEHYCIGCQFSHCFDGDCMPVSGYDVAYVANCISGYAKRDIYNHHATGLTDELIDACVYVNINCEAEEAGWYNTTTDENNNLYTAHEGINILRCSCNGSNAAGPMLVDVGGCRSVVMDCTFCNNSYTDLTPDNQVWFDQSTAAGAKKGFATLINVFSGDTVHPNSKKLKSRCDIEISGGNLLDNAQFLGSLKIGNL